MDPDVKLWLDQGESVQEGIGGWLGMGGLTILR